jgi:hypothetical protein
MLGIQLNRLLVLTLVNIASNVTFAGSPPRPFSAITATRTEFRCLGRNVELGTFLLPTKIRASSGDLLSSSVQLVSDPPTSLEVVPSTIRAKVLTHSANSASWQFTAESRDFRIQSSLTADYDGFCWYELTLEPKHPVALKLLGLRVPRTKSSARYLHTSSYDWSNVSQGLPELGGHWSSHFVPYVWLGDEERGLAWCAESDESWMLDHAERAISIETVQTNALESGSSPSRSVANTVLLKITFLDHKRLITSPIKLRFSLQPSPVKPVSFGWRANARILHDIHYDSCKPATNGACELDTLRAGGVKTVVIHDSWTKYFGQMVPADADEFRRLIRACHDRDIRLLVYVGYGVARTAPELQGKHDLWSATPLIPWDPGYKPETRGFDATCPRSPWADWLVASAEKLFSDFDLDGLYFDGTSEAWRCNNQSHGCGWKDAQGNVHTVYPILAARQLMRRMADTVHRHKPDAILDVHMSSNLTLPTLSFCDSLWNGEQFETHTEAEHFQVPLHRFRTEFMGYAHGMDMEFLCYENRPFTFNEAIALAWLHGIEVRPYPKTLQYVTPIWRALDRFGVPKARWMPYWANSGVTSDNENAKASAWIRDGTALVIASHLRRTNESVMFQIDRNRLGLKSKSLRARDALTGEPLALSSNAIALSFDGMSWRLLELR